MSKVHDQFVAITGSLQQVFEYLFYFSSSVIFSDSFVTKKSSQAHSKHFSFVGKLTIPSAAVV